jgi:nicotinate-nucleotide pyrophosphorylase (carboxylating)
MNTATNDENTLITLALNEDLGLPWQDVTCEYLFAKQTNLQEIAMAKIISKHPTELVFCGLALAKKIAQRIANSISISSHYQDGDLLATGDVLLTLQGPRAALLMLERTLLNFLRHSCAVATMTRQFVEKIKHYQTQILDTRKTTPGFRLLDKYAVTCGGGVNHRMGLYDAIMLKDTHVNLVGGMAQALAQLPQKKLAHLPVIVEIHSVKDLAIALDYKQYIDRILLDNMPLDLLQHCVANCRDKIATEASGNINLDNISQIAATGVDYASVGMITHSAGNVDLSMKVD